MITWLAQVLHRNDYTWALVYSFVGAPAEHYDRFRTFWSIVHDNR